MYLLQWYDCITLRTGAKPRVGMLKRRETEAEFSRTTEALNRNLPLEKQVEEDEEEEEEGECSVMS